MVYPKTYIITTAQKGAEPFEKFLEGLKARAGKRGEIIILPTNGALRGKAAKNETLDPLFNDKNNYRILENSFPLNNNISIARDIVPKAEAPYPLDKPGEIIEVGKAGIITSPKIRMKVYHDEAAEAHKILVSTGAVTHSNYPLSEKGTVARLRHQYGALIVEVEGKQKYHFRQLNADETGVFYDLGYRYDGRKTPKQEPLEALVLGDWHEGYNPAEVVKATEKMVAELKPKEIYLHDLFDGDAISFFHEKDTVYRSQLVAQGRNLLIPAFKACRDRLIRFSQLAPETEIYVVKSNHDERLTSYIRDGRYQNDDANRGVGSRLFAEMQENKQDPLVFGINYYGGKLPANVHFLQRVDNRKIGDWTLSAHGDLGGGGRKATTKSLAKSHRAIICGHTHSAEIERNVFRAGTSTYLLANYTEGNATNWTNSHVALPKNGHPQIINIVHGRYRPA